MSEDFHSIGSKSGIEGLESFEVAQGVISSLRAKRMAKKNYQQYEDSSNLINVQELNSLISRQKVSFEEYNKNKIKVEGLLESTSPTIQVTSVAQTETRSLGLPPIEAKSPSLNTVKYKEEEDSDDEYDFDRPKLSDSQNRKSSNQKSESAHKPTRIPANYDEFLNEDDDDDSNDGLFSSDFVPPSKTKKSSDQSLSKSLAKGSSIKGDVVNSAIRKGIVIKPGQAIRVSSKSLKKPTQS